MTDGDKLAYCIKAGKQFCLFVEAKMNQPDEKNVKSFHELLVDLYAKMLKLPPVQLLTDHEYSNEIDENLFESVKTQLSLSLGKHRFYRSVFDPTVDLFHPKETLVGDLLDDILDIYRDVKANLTTHDIGSKEAINAAHWGFYFSFWHHWGCHAINAMRTLHYVLEKNEKYKL